MFSFKGSQINIRVFVVSMLLLSCVVRSSMIAPESSPIIKSNVNGVKPLVAPMESPIIKEVLLVPPSNSPTIFKTLTKNLPHIPTGVSGIPAPLNTTLTLSSLTDRNINHDTQTIAAETTSAISQESITTDGSSSDRLKNMYFNVGQI